MKLTGKKTFEDFAEVAFRGRKWRAVTSVFTMVSLLGFTTAYVSLIKTLIPSIAVSLVGPQNEASLPWLLQNNESSRVFWATIFSFAVLMPLACLRKLSSVRFFSMLGVLCSLVLMAVLFQ